MKCSFLHENFSKLRAVVWLHQTFKEKMSFYQIMLVLLKALSTGARVRGLKPKNMSTELWRMIDSQKKSFAINILQLWLRWVWFLRLLSHEDNDIGNRAIDGESELFVVVVRGGQELQTWLTITMNDASTTTSTMTATCAYPLLLPRKLRIPINNPITVVMTLRSITPQLPIPQSTLSVQPLPENINF